MQKLLIGLLTPLIEKLFIGLYKKVLAGIEKAKEANKDRKFAKSLKKEKDAQKRAQRLNDRLND